MSFSNTFISLDDVDITTLVAGRYLRVRGKWQLRNYTRNNFNRSFIRCRNNWSIHTVYWTISRIYSGRENGVLAHWTFIVQVMV